MMREKYEVEGNSFTIFDEELGIDVIGELEFLDKETFPNGQIRYQSYRKGDKLHGPSLFYHKEGQLLSEAWFYEGIAIGKVHRYYPNGNLYCIERYAQGVYHLAQEYYYLDGSKKTITHYDLGVLNGKTELFWPDGTLKRRTLYANGQRESDHFYDEKGERLFATV